MAGRLLQRCNELVKDVIVRGMADKRVNGNGFSQRGKIAHGSILLPGRRSVATSREPGVLMEYCRVTAKMECAAGHTTGKRL